MENMISRRSFLGTTALAATGFPGALNRALAADATAPPPIPAIPVIDTHIHLYDPFRPGGTPWPNPANKILLMPA